MTNNESKRISDLNDLELLSATFACIETNAYECVHKGKVNKRDQKREHELKAECVKRFAHGSFVTVESPIW